MIIFNLPNKSKNCFEGCKLNEMQFPFLLRSSSLKFQFYKAKEYLRYQYVLKEQNKTKAGTIIRDTGFHDLSFMSLLQNHFFNLIHSPVHYTDEINTLSKTT